MLAEYGVTTNPSAPIFNYIYAGSERIAMRKAPSGDLHYYLNDHLGSARVVIDSAGVVKDKMEYFVFGEMETETSSTGQDLKYTGKQFDDEGGLNLYYYGARYYDADIGRFAAIDPRQGDSPEWSPYVYMLDNPLKLTDPDRRTPVMAGVGALVGGLDTAHIKTKQNEYPKLRMLVP